MKEQRYYATKERRSVEPFAHEVGLKIPRRVHPEVPKEGHLRQTPVRHREVHPPMLRVQRGRNQRGPCDGRPHTHACTDTPEALRLELHGVPERQDEPDDLRRAREPEIQLRVAALLGGRVLRERGRPQQGHRPEVHPRPGARGPGLGSSQPEGVQGPVHG